MRSFTLSPSRLWNGFVIGRHLQRRINEAVQSKTFQRTHVQRERTALRTKEQRLGTRIRLGISQWSIHEEQRNRTPHGTLVFPGGVILHWTEIPKEPLETFSQVRPGVDCIDEGFERDRQDRVIRDNGRARGSERVDRFEEHRACFCSKGRVINDEGGNPEAFSPQCVSSQVLGVRAALCLRCRTLGPEVLWVFAGHDGKRDRSIGNGVSHWPGVVEQPVQRVNTIDTYQPSRWQYANQPTRARGKPN